MPSYTTIFVLALAVSNVSPALSAPVPYGGLHLSVKVRAFLTMFNSSRLVREQSLSHRGPALSKRIAWGPLLKKVAIDLGIGTASTVVGYTALDALTGPSKAPAPAQVPAASGPPPANSGPPPANSGPPPAASGPPPAASGPPPATYGPPPATSGPPPATSGPPPATSGPLPATSGPPAPAPATNSNNPNTYYSTYYTDPNSSSSSSIFGEPDL
jgi:hypothetical protein